MADVFELQREGLFKSVRAKRWEPKKVSSVRNWFYKNNHFQSNPQIHTYTQNTLGQRLRWDLGVKKIALGGKNNFLLTFRTFFHKLKKQLDVYIYHQFLLHSFTNCLTDTHRNWYLLMIFFLILIVFRKWKIRLRLINDFVRSNFFLSTPATTTLNLSRWPCLVSKPMTIHSGSVHDQHFTSLTFSKNKRRRRVNPIK